MILPPGTKVVFRVPARVVGGGRSHPAGSVGVIAHAPVDDEHSYLLRLADGSEVALRRSEFAILKEVQREGFASPEPAISELDLVDCVVYRCVIGSRAYGLDNADSDTDRRGVYLPPAALHWSLFGVPEQLEDDDRQECFWEYQKFVVLALKANPNVLECLYSPLVEHVAPVAQPLLDNRAAFLSKLVYQTYNGYVLSQFKKLDADMRNHGRIKWKHAMHLIRLLLAGIVILREGYVPLRVAAERDELLAIRDGQRAWADVDAWRLRLHGAFESAFEQTTLPDRPNYELANDLLIAARRERAASESA